MIAIAERLKVDDLLGKDGRTFCLGWEWLVTTFMMGLVEYPGIPDCSVPFF